MEAHSGLKRVGIVISGGGSNMVALIEAMQAERFAEPVVVISNRPEAAGLAKAAALGVPTVALDHKLYGKDRAAFDDAMQAALDAAEVELVALAGFMRIMTDEMVERWTGRMLNIHPALLPAFKGLDTHQRALDARCAVHGCTVHEVTPALDDGPTLGQAVVPVRATDTAESLAARVLTMEHKLYPRILADFVRDPEAARRTPVALAHADLTTSP